MATTEDYDPPLFQTPLVNQFNHHVDSEDKEFIDAKAFLLQSSTVTGINLYDHLSNILNKVLEERPCNAVDILEELSKLEKRNRYNVKSDGIIDKPDLTTEVALAEIQRRLFSKRGGDTAQEEEEEEEEEEDDEDDENSPLPDLMQLCYHFEQAGVGLNREEMVRIWLALKALSKQHQFTMIRFWGKIFGMEQNYIVAEVQFEEGEDPEEDDDEADDEQEEEESAKDKLGDDEEEGEEEEEEDKLPQIKFKPPPVVPKEDKGTGVNKMTYYVCTEPGKPWVKLPSVTPAQISVARKIKKFFTGRLDAPIISYPPFEGREAHYLRAQIARISAGTQISPRGYYQFDEDEDEPEEGEIRENVVINEEYEPLAVAELIDPSLENWVHHTLHILPQGRVKWWNPKDAEGEGEEEEAEDEEDKEEPEELEPEVGPPLLTPLSEDADLNGQPAWTTRISSKLMRKYAVAVIHSCLWPGAHAFATDKTFENIYIGWGHKYSADNFSPTLPPELQTEFPSGPEITEAKDPTVAEEAAHKAAKAAREEGEEEEEDDEDDDDDAGDDDDGDED